MRTSTVISIIITVCAICSIQSNAQTRTNQKNLEEKNKSANTKLQQNKEQEPELAVNFMKTTMTKKSLGLQFTQIAWVVKDIKTSKKYFQEVMGISNFSAVDTIRVKEFGGTYYGKPSNAESLVSLAYSGGTFIELIQPVSGNSVFQDYLDKNPAGGIQHVAYSTSVANLDKVISEFADKGFPVISSFNHPIATIVFFDTRDEIGVMTEIMGITKEGEEMVQQMKK